jgi:hypothetical protein
MMNKKDFRSTQAVLGLSILAFLMFWFGRYIQTGSFDLVQHYLLVDEIMKHGGILPDAPQRMGAMAFYPPAAHWMAAVIGWIGGSGLVGITLVTIASLYFCYLIIAHLVGAHAPANIVLLTLAFLVLRFTRSQIGWEVVANFFYPQLVADVAYFGVLLWVANCRDIWKQALAFLLTGALTMWIQPLIAIHVLAAGCVLMGFQFLEMWRNKPLHRVPKAILLVLFGVVSAAIILLHPEFRIMREISANDGYLVFGYNQVLLVAILCGAIGVINLLRRLAGRGEYVDAVLGCAVVAATLLAILQFTLLKLNNDGSAYAVKKHMFIVCTLGMMNAVRLIAAYLPLSKYKLSPGWIAPVFAAFASFFVLKGFATPVAPIVNALAYANHAASFDLPDFTPGNTVADDSSLPLMGNVMISLTAFQHSFDATAISWQRGASIKEGAPYAMVMRTPYIDKICSDRLAENQNYTIVKPTCLKRYLPNEVLSLAPGGNGWQYASNGWSGADAWGTWSLADVGGQIDLSLPETAKGPYQLVVDGMAYLNPKHPSQPIDVLVNGTKVATWSFDLKSPAGERSANIPQELVQNGSLHIVFAATGAVSPAQVGDSADARLLGIAVKTIVLRTTPDAS